MSSPRLCVIRQPLIVCHSAAFLLFVILELHFIGRLSAASLLFVIPQHRDRVILSGAQRSRRIQMNLDATHTAPSFRRTALHAFALPRPKSLPPAASLFFVIPQRSGGICFSYALAATTLAQPSSTKNKTLLYYGLRKH